MEPLQTNPEQHKFATKEVLLPIIALVLVIGIAFAVSSLLDTAPVSETTEEEVIVARADASSSEKSIPVGFPMDIHVDISTLTESVSITYPERNVVLHTVMFSTQESPINTYTQYLEYMNDAGYQFPPTGLNEELGALYGLKNSDELSVIISDGGDKTLVQLNYLDRQ